MSGLGQPTKALEMYDSILQTDAEAMTNASPGLKAVFDMAKWRERFFKVEHRSREGQSCL